MKKTILITLACSAILQFRAQNSDSTFYYNADGQKIWWYFQHDVYAFRLHNGQEYQSAQTNPMVVDKIDYQKQSPRQLNVMEFKPNSIDTDREIERGKPRIHPNFECEFPVLTKERLLTKEAGNWHTTNDQLIIVFDNPDITDSEVAQFAARNKLILVHRPYTALPRGTWSYIFQKRSDFCMNKSSIDLAREIFEQEPNLVRIAEPDMALFEGHSCADRPAEMSAYFGNNRLWFIDNNGGQVLGPNNIGLSDADADICECWDQGYHGTGVKVAVIDFSSGFEFSHSDLTDVLLPGWNFTTSPETPMSTDTYSKVDRSHTTSICGLVAGNANDGKTLGVARGAKIIPFLSTNEESSVIKCIQKALLEKADIVLMPFGNFDSNTSAFYNEITNSTTFGRPNPWNPDQLLGTVFVASVGNDNVSDKGKYPAAFPEVIGVGASNIQDFRCAPNDPNNTNWTATGLIGSNYGDFSYDVVAPGSFLEVDAFQNDSYNIQGGTSYSAAIVAGVAAILLQKNPGMTWQEVMQTIRSGTDRIREDVTYFYYETDIDKSSEVFYGRVSCGKALNLTTLGLEKQHLDQQHFSVFEFAPRQFRVHDLSKSELLHQATLYNALGQEQVNFSMSAGSAYTDFNTNNLQSGMYHLVVRDKNHNFIQNFKLILE